MAILHGEEFFEVFAYDSEVSAMFEALAMPVARCLLPYGFKDVLLEFFK